MKRLFNISIALLIAATAFAQSFSPSDKGAVDVWLTANQAYSESRYDEAAQLYQSLIDDAPELTRAYAPVYYNLGNARFKQGELSQAILAYERCLRLDPTNKNARFNLEFARTRIVDNIADTQVFFLRQWTLMLRNSLPMHVWMWLSICLFTLALVSLLLFAFSHSLAVRKSGFYVGIVGFIISAVAFANAASLHHRDTVRAEAIITRGIVNAKASPDRGGTELFTVHEGTKVLIHEVLDGYANIEVGNYNGWIPLGTLERI